MKYPYIVLDELKRFDEKLLNTKDKEIIQKAKEVIGYLISFINIAVRSKQKCIPNMIKKLSPLRKFKQ